VWSAPPPTSTPGDSAARPHITETANTVTPRNILFPQNRQQVNHSLNSGSCVKLSYEFVVEIRARPCQTQITRADDTSQDVFDEPVCSICLVYNYAYIPHCTQQF